MCCDIETMEAKPYVKHGELFITDTWRIRRAFMTTTEINDMYSMYQFAPRQEQLYLPYENMDRDAIVSRMLSRLGPAMAEAVACLRKTPAEMWHYRTLK